MDGGLDEQQGKNRALRPRDIGRPAREHGGRRPVRVLRSASEEPFQPAEEAASLSARGGRRSGRGSGGGLGRGTACGGLGCGRCRSFLRWRCRRLRRRRDCGPAHLLVVAAQDGVLRYASTHLLVMPSQNGICRHCAHDRLLRLKATTHCNQYAIGITPGQRGRSGSFHASTVPASISRFAWIPASAGMTETTSRHSRGSGNPPEPCRLHWKHCTSQRDMALRGRWRHGGRRSADHDRRVPRDPPLPARLPISSAARRRRGPGFVDASRWRPGMPVRCEARSLRRRTWRRS